jgi:hypothetical protein
VQVKDKANRVGGHKVGQGAFVGVMVAVVMWVGVNLVRDAEGVRPRLLMKPER